MDDKESTVSGMSTIDTDLTTRNILECFAAVVSHDFYSESYKRAEEINNGKSLADNYKIIIKAKVDNVRRSQELSGLFIGKIIGVYNRAQQVESAKINVSVFLNKLKDYILPGEEMPPDRLHKLFSLCLASVMEKVEKYILANLSLVIHNSTDAGHISKCSKKIKKFSKKAIEEFKMVTFPSYKAGGVSTTATDQTEPIKRALAVTMMEKQKALIENESLKDTIKILEGEKQQLLQKIAEIYEQQINGMNAVGAVAAAVTAPVITKQPTPISVPPKAKSVSSASSKKTNAQYQGNYVSPVPPVPDLSQSAFGDADAFSILSGGSSASKKEKNYFD